MTRPRKQTVDYFPHSCTHGKTMFILEQEYGNDGYAFWFKLLEQIGASEGHSLDLNNIATAKYLFSTARVSEEVAWLILDLLASLDAIDAELWKSKIVWSDNFIKGIADVYRNRRINVPIKPDNYTQKSASEGITTPRNPQSKVNESKVNETRTNNAPPSPDGDNGSAIQARIYDPIVFSLTYFQLKKSAFEKLRRKGAALSDQEFKDLLDRVDMYAAENPRKYKRRADGSLANPSGVINTFLERKFIDNRGSPGSPSEPKGYNSLREFYHKQKEPE